MRPDRVLNQSDRYNVLNHPNVKIRQSFIHFQKYFDPPPPDYQAPPSIVYCTMRVRLNGQSDLTLLPALNANANVSLLILKTERVCGQIL